MGKFLYTLNLFHRFEIFVIASAPKISRFLESVADLKQIIMDKLSISISEGSVYISLLLIELNLGNVTYRHMYIAFYRLG